MLITSLECPSFQRKADGVLQTNYEDEDKKLDKDQKKAVEFQDNRQVCRLSLNRSEGFGHS